MLLLDIIKNRAIDETNYIINTKKTIREIANQFNVSKSTVHKDLQERLPNINKTLADLVKIIMQEHITIRHIKGGQSTKEKYKRLK